MRPLLLVLLLLLAACNGPQGPQSEALDAIETPETLEDSSQPADLIPDSSPDLEAELPDLPPLEGLGPWQRVGFVPGGLEGRALRALALGGDEAVVVGDGGLVLRRRGQGRFSPVASQGPDLHGAWFRQDGAAILCGAAGTLLMLDDEGLRPFSPQPPETRDWLAIRGQGQRFHLAGRGGALLFFDGQDFQPQETFLTGALPTLALRSQVEVFAGSDQGSVLRLEGQAWLSTQIFGAASAVSALGFASDGRLFAGGSGGELAILDDGLWRAAASNDPLGRALRAVAPDQPIFVGDRGLLLRPSGPNWVVDGSALPQGLTADLLALEAGPDGTLLLAGSEGTLLEQRPQEAWKPLPVLPDLEILAAATDLAGGLWLGGRDFLYHSEDGLAWVGAALPWAALVTALLPLDQGGVLAATADGRLLTLETPGRSPDSRLLEGRPGLAALCGVGDALILAGADGYLALLDAGGAVQRLESGLASDLDCCLSLGDRVLLPGAPGQILSVDASGSLGWEPLPWPLRARGLTQAEPGRVLALLEDGSVVRRSADGTWEPLFSAGLGLSILARDPSGRLLALGPAPAEPGRQALLLLGNEGQVLGASLLPQDFPVAFLKFWQDSWLLGGAGGRLYRAAWHPLAP